MRKKIIFFSLIIILFFIISSSVFAKYIIEEKILVATIQIDRTSPNVEISYSKKEITQENITITITSDEQIKEIEGWTLQANKKVLIKEYTNNITEQIEIEDLSGNKTVEQIVINNIDRQAPIVTIEKIENSNKQYQTYANQDSIITATIKITDDRKINTKLNIADIKIIVGNQEIIPKQIKLENQQETETEKIIKLIFSKIEQEGNLKIQIPEGVIQDESQNKNKTIEKETKIKIDNTKPQGLYSQNKIEAGKIEAIITANEKIRKLDGWNIENETILKKIFNNNLSYITKIQDFAGNSSDVEINITGATNVILSYASHNSMVGWSYGYENYDIAGLQAIKKNSIYKTESLLFTISGNVEKDFLQARAFVYSHWKEGSKAICTNTKKIYSYGWNPSKTDWKYENEENKVRINNRTYFQLGGAGINAEGNTDINGNGVIDIDTTMKFNYGISALQMKLKSYQDNSILYQIYIDSIGWLKPAKNEELTCYKQDKPMSAIRIALVPNSEVKSVFNSWNKDTGKLIK